METSHSSKVRCETPAVYELVEHTADIGILVSGSSVEEVFAKAAVALADLQFDPSLVERRRKLAVVLEDADGERLLVRWLNELIVLRETRDFLWTAVEVELTRGSRLSALLEGETFDEARHVPRMGVKAATYHQLRLEQTVAGVGARVIFDV